MSPKAIEYEGLDVKTHDSLYTPIQLESIKTFRMMMRRREELELLLESRLASLCSGRSCYDWKMSAMIRGLQRIYQRKCYKLRALL